MRKGNWNPWNKRPAEERFWSKVEKTATCWNWQGAKIVGYGVFWSTRKKGVRAHRYAYELLKGPIPEGLVTDHLCRNPSCVNPDHLDIVTHQINTLRGIGPSSINARKTHCKNGHPFTEANTLIRIRERTLKPKRACLICNRKREKERYERRKAQ